MNQLLRERLRAKVAALSERIAYITSNLDVFLSPGGDLSELQSKLRMLGILAASYSDAFATANTDRAYTQFCEFVEECLVPAHPDVVAVSSDWDLYKQWTAAARKPRIIYQGQFKSFEHIHPCLLVRRPDCVFPFQ